MCEQFFDPGGLAMASVEALRREHPAWRHPDTGIRYRDLSIRRVTGLPSRISASPAYPVLAAGNAALLPAATTSLLVSR
jgi:hypothetical protein